MPEPTPTTSELVEEVANLLYPHMGMTKKSCREIAEKVVKLMEEK